MSDLKNILTPEMTYEQYEKLKMSKNFNEVLLDNREALLILEQNKIINNMHDYDLICLDNNFKYQYNDDINEYINHIKYLLCLNNFDPTTCVINCIGKDVIFITRKFKDIPNTLFILPIHKNKDIFIAKLKMLFYI